MTVSQPPSVLVVDDEAPMCEMLVDQLFQAGYRAASATSGEEAIELLASATFDVVLSDVRMRGGKGGFELLRVVLGSDRSMPVILMTSFGSSEIERQALAEGAVAFLRKPFDPGRLLDVLAEVASG